MNFQNPQLRDGIPPLTSVAPSIFVPITTDLTDPFEKPTSEVDRLRKVLETIDLHSAAVKANILHMFDLEITRTRREAKEAEKATWDAPNTDTNVGLSKDEFERLARKVETHAEPHRSYQINGEIPTPIFDEVEGEAASLSLRERYARRVLYWVEMAIGQVEGYTSHVEDMKTEYQKALNDALQKEFGK
jgi:hypothetical protein